MTLKTKREFPIDGQGLFSFLTKNEAISIFTENSGHTFHRNGARESNFNLYEQLLQISFQIQEVKIFFCKRKKGLAE